MLFQSLFLNPNQTASWIMMLTSPFIITGPYIIRKLEAVSENDVLGLKLVICCCMYLLLMSIIATAIVSIIRIICVHF